MPVFNAEAFLEECLESILAQSYEDWELIAVDDFSTDDSFPFLSAYAMIDERIQVFKNSEKGIIPALQKAYAQSNGEFITRMDADDIMHEQKLEKLLEASDEGAVSTAKVEYFHAEGDVGPGFLRYADWLNELTDSGGHWKEIYKECVIPSPAWMMDRQTFESVKGFEPKRYPEDYDLVFRCYEAGLKVKAVPEVLHYWRDHSSRASRVDPNYADNWFLDLKMDYFLKVDRNETHPLVLWGAGKKGKVAARNLLNRGIDFMWVTDNIKKRGVPIYHVQLEHSSMIPEDAQCILTIAGPEEQKEIRTRFKNIQKLEAFWFC